MLVYILCTTKWNAVSYTHLAVMAWQSEMLNYRDKNGKPYSPVYLKTLNNQLSAVFNHAVKHYNLKVNPCLLYTSRCV